MSTIMSLGSTVRSVTSRQKTDEFQDLPLIDRATRLTVMELKNSDKQIINELVYRWCRVMTRSPRCDSDQRLPSMPTDNLVSSLRRVLLLDMIGSINPIRLGTVLKRDDRRMRMIALARGCKINSTYVTLSSYLGQGASIPSSLRLVVIYQDEFFIVKTLTLIKRLLVATKCHVVIIVPRLDRNERDILNLISNYQILKCDFCVARRQIGPAPPETSLDSYQAYLNEFYIQRYPSNKNVPDKMYGNLKDDRLYIDVQKTKKHKAEARKSNGPVLKRLKPSLDSDKTL